jgi:hypothetical protein
VGFQKCLLRCVQIRAVEGCSTRHAVMLGCPRGVVQIRPKWMRSLVNGDREPPQIIVSNGDGGAGKPTNDVRKKSRLTE